MPAIRRLVRLAAIALPAMLLGALCYRWSRSGPADDPALAPGRQLYARHCALCHGDRGDGQGPARSASAPTPDFGALKFRLVSTVNAVPSDDDLRRVIEDGIPGTPMGSTRGLTDGDIEQLIAYVRHLTRARIVDRLRRDAEAAGLDIDPVRLEERVRRLTEPGPPIELPAHFPEPTAESIARGTELFRRECAACHGPSGKGDGTRQQLNWDGTPARPRDLTQGLFKGGRDRKQLYARIRAGMPGTPMPPFFHLSPEQIGDVVNYVLSLSEGR